MYIGENSALVIILLDLAIIIIIVHIFQFWSSLYC